MTVRALDMPPAGRVLRRTGFTIAADGSYAACLAEAAPPATGPARDAGPATGTARNAGPAAGDARNDAPARHEGTVGKGGTVGNGGPARGDAPASADGSAAGELEPDGPAPGGAGAADGDGGGRWFLERWTLDGPEPYAVALAGTQPEEAGTQVLPLSDGRVLISRRVADRHDLVLLYPTDPGTGEVPVCSLPGTAVRLLPPSPAAGTAYALVYDADAGPAGTTAVWRVYGDGAPGTVMSVEGRCTGGVWLDRGGRLLAVDRELGGRTKAVAADLHTGEVSALLQITDDSDDRLLLAEPDSGLLMLCSDATGEARLGWGVLGSRRPVRFPEALRVAGARLHPVAAQPGQILSPESCVVALRAQVPGGTESLALWRPRERRLHWRASPPGWLGPTAFWLPGHPLRLPYATPQTPSALAAYPPPPPPPEPEPAGAAPTDRRRPIGPGGGTPHAAPAVVPLQQSPLARAV